MRWTVFVGGGPLSPDARQRRRGRRSWSESHSAELSVTDVVDSVHRDECAGTNGSDDFKHQY